MLDRTDFSSTERVHGVVGKLLAKRSLDPAVGRYDDLVGLGDHSARKSLCIHFRDSFHLAGWASAFRTDCHNLAYQGSAGACCGLAGVCAGCPEMTS